MHTQYDVNSTGNIVSLTLKILFGHPGTTRIFVDHAQIMIPGSNPPDGDFINDIISLPIGTNSDLNGKSLAIFTTVAGVSPSGNAGVRFSLEGGVNNIDYPPLLQPVAHNKPSFFPIVVDFY